MALIVADRVLETSSTTGTGALTLAAAVTGYRRFSAVCSTNDTCYYTIVAVDSNGNPSGDWEVGLGTYSSANTLTRTTPQASTNSNNAVNFGAGTKYVFLAATTAYLGGFQPLDSDLTAIAALATATYGRSLLTLADAAAGRSSLSAAATSQTGEQISGFIASPSDKSYTIVLKMAHAGTITETTTISASGTCTATFKINSTALGGTANSVSSSEQSQTHSSTNTFAAGDDIVLTVSSNSSCADMSFTIKYTRTLA